MFYNRLAEEIIYVHLEDQRDIEMAKRSNYIAQFPNDNTTTWDTSPHTKKKEKVDHTDYVSLKFFRYMANVPVDVFKQLQKHFSY